MKNTHNIFKGIFLAATLVFGVAGSGFIAQDAVAAQSQDVPKPSQVKAAINNGDWVLAHSLIKKVVKANPDKPQVWYMKAQIEERLLPSGKSTPQEALESLQKAMNLDPTYGFGTSVSNVVQLQERLASRIAATEKIKTSTVAKNEPIQSQQVNTTSDVVNHVEKVQKMENKEVPAVKHLPSVENSSSKDSGNFLFFVLGLFIIAGAIFGAFNLVGRAKEKKAKLAKLALNEEARMKAMEMATDFSAKLDKEIDYIELDLPEGFDGSFITKSYKETREHLISLIESLSNKNKGDWSSDISSLEKLIKSHAFNQLKLKEAQSKAQSMVGDINGDDAQKTYSHIKSTTQNLIKQIDGIETDISRNSSAYSSNTKIKMSSIKADFQNLHEQNEYIHDMAKGEQAYGELVKERKLVEKMKADIFEFNLTFTNFKQEQKNYADKIEAERQAKIAAEERRKREERERVAAEKREEERRQQRIRDEEERRQQRIRDEEYRRTHPQSRHTSSNNGNDLLTGVIIGSILNSGSKSSSSSSSSSRSDDTGFDWGSNKSSGGFDFGNSSNNSSSSFDFGSKSNDDDKW